MFLLLFAWSAAAVYARLCRVSIKVSRCALLEILIFLLEVMRGLPHTTRVIKELYPPSYPGRCPICCVRQTLCICDSIPRIENSTYLTVVMHHRERYKTTNTARLACMALVNSQLLFRGVKDQPIQMEQTERPGTQPILLTLNDKSEVLTREWVLEQRKPIHLIVPDGNWRQAHKAGRREPALQSAVWVKLPPGALSNYQLRREHLTEGLCTIEAIARALAIIESPVMGTQLEEILHLMVSRTISTRPSHQMKNA